MNSPRIQSHCSSACYSVVASLLLAIPPGRRGTVLQCRFSDRPIQGMDSISDLDLLRQTFVECCAEALGHTGSMDRMRLALTPPVPMRIAMEFTRFMEANTVAAIIEVTVRIVELLAQCSVATA